MDTSPEYIKMCKAAPEIQGLRNGSDSDWDYGDYWYSDANKSGSSFWEEHWGIYDSSITFRILPATFLPRQDQLQEMIQGKLFVREDEPGAILDIVSMPFDSFDRFLDLFVDGEDKGNQWWNEYALKFKSMEQLWLAFVLSEKYGKSWNGTEWVSV